MQNPYKKKYILRRSRPGGISGNVKGGTLLKQAHLSGSRGMGKLTGGKLRMEQWGSVKPLVKPIHSAQEPARLKIGKRQGRKTLTKTSSFAPPRGIEKPRSAKVGNWSIETCKPLRKSNTFCTGADQVKVQEMGRAGKPYQNKLICLDPGVLEN